MNAQGIYRIELNGKELATIEQNADTHTLKIQGEEFFKGTAHSCIKHIMNFVQELAPTTPVKFVYAPTEKMSVEPTPALQENMYMSNLNERGAMEFYENSNAIFNDIPMKEEKTFSGNVLGAFREAHVMEFFNLSYCPIQDVTKVYDHDFKRICTIVLSEKIGWGGEQGDYIAFNIDTGYYSEPMPINRIITQIVERRNLTCNLNNL